MITYQKIILALLLNAKHTWLHYVMQRLLDNIDDLSTVQRKWGITPHSKRSMWHVMILWEMLCKSVKSFDSAFCRTLIIPQQCVRETTWYNSLKYPCTAILSNDRKSQNGASRIVAVGKKNWGTFIARGSILFWGQIGLEFDTHIFKLNLLRLPTLLRLLRLHFSHCSAVVTS